MGWFAVRTIIRGIGGEPWSKAALAPGERAYEERITLWRARDSDEAMALAQAEAAEYAEALDAQALAFCQSFELFDEPGHGGEVFSLIRRSSLGADDYLNHFFDGGTEHQQRLDD